MKKAVLLLLILLPFLSGCAAAETAAETYTTETGVQFRMTLQEVLDIETARGNETMETHDGFESYQMSYEENIHLYSLRCRRMEYDFDTIDRRLYQVSYYSDDGAAAYSYLRYRILSEYGEPVEDEKDEGKYSLLYDQVGWGTDHIEVTHWIAEDGSNLGIDLWWNEYNSLFAVFYDCSNPASCGAQQKVYSDESGISFVFPDGWDVWKLGAEPDALKISFLMRHELYSSVDYSRVDYYGFLQDIFGTMDSEREAYNTDFISENLIASITGSGAYQNFRKEEHGGIPFCVFDFRRPGEFSQEPEYECTAALTMKDGILHVLRLSSDSGQDELMPAFEKLLDSVRFRDE